MVSLSDEVTSSVFRTLMAGFPTGVAVITTSDAEGFPRGMTCSSVCAVALEPPTLLVCVRLGSPTLEAMLWRSTFAVNLLNQGAQLTAELFASGAPHRFDQVHWQHDAKHGGPHLVEDAHATADCRISGHRSVGDHRVVFGEVYGVTHHGGPQPLLYGLRRYMAWPAD